jgi:hypothetical protein
MEKSAVYLNLDLESLKNISVQGVRRTAAFIAIALNATRDAAQQSVSLPSASTWRFFPEPVPQELVINSVAEFRSWVVGAALRELDAAFNEFLDRAWAMNERSKLHGKQVKSDHTIDAIDAKINVGTKMALLLKELGEENPDNGKLWTLSNLRNCLTHARGHVTEKHVNDAEGLKVMWLGLELGFEQGGVFAPMPNPIPELGIQAPNPAESANIVVKIVERAKTFPLGSFVLIDPAELHELCHFYLTSTDKVIERLLATLSGRGVEVAEKKAPVEEISE